LKWHGESIGFWDGDALIVHTNQIRGWLGGPSEFTDNLETIEHYQRVGNVIEGEIGRRSARSLWGWANSVFISHQCPSDPTRRANCRQWSYG
jgi:hypothetical protein